MGTIDTIRAALPEDELLCQLAEEAAELADVRLCAEVLDRGTRIINQIDGIATSKLGRWAKRLEEVHHEC